MLLTEHQEGTTQVVPKVGELKTLQAPPRPHTLFTHKYLESEVVAPRPPSGGAAPTRWWRRAHQVVAPGPPSGGTGPTKWWHRAHHRGVPLPSEACIVKSRYTYTGYRSSDWRSGATAHFMQHHFFVLPAVYLSVAP